MENLKVLPTKIAGYYLHESQGTTYGNRGVQTYGNRGELPTGIAGYYLTHIAGYYLRSTQPHRCPTADLFLTSLWVQKVLQVVLLVVLLTTSHTPQGDALGTKSTFSSI